MSEHTKTPWKMTPIRPGDKEIHIDLPDCWSHPAITVNFDDVDHDVQRANAEFIIEAVNAHDVLLDIVRDLALAYDGQMDIYDVGERAKEFIATLKAEGKAT